ncbi:hypothetical protein IAT40_005995 [Kwoniella sp. CBS 6097]
MVAIAGLNLPANLSFYAIPVMWVTSIAPHFYAISVYNSERAAGTEEWDNREPKKNLEKVKSAKLSPSAAEKFERGEAAQNNGFENLPLFAAAIVAGNVARLPTSTLNIAAGVYLASRVAYNVIYITNSTKFAANLRSVTYLTGIATVMTLFVKAGNAFSSSLLL